MPSVAQPTVLYQFEGSNSGGGKWSCGLWTLLSQVTEADLDMQTAATDASAAFTTLFNLNLKSLNAPQTTYDQCVASYYQAGGTAVFAKATAPRSQNAAGSSTSSAAASQALVVTTLTGHPGKTGRGRMYLPMTGNLGSGADAFRVPAATLAGVVEDLVDFFISIERTSIDGNHVTFPAVRSVKDGVARQFQDFAVDQRPDRQEHRERGLSFTRVQQHFA